MKISNKIKVSAVALTLAISGVMCGFLGCRAFAANEAGCPKNWTSKHGTCVPPDENNVDVWTLVRTGMNWILAIVGVIAVFMIIFGGIQYTISSGDSGKVKKAKDTILYGLVGLVIALLAAAIVNFVLNNLFKSREVIEGATQTNCASKDGEWDAEVSKCYKK